jgi:hypothetical protein
MQCIRQKHFSPELLPDFSMFINVFKSILFSFTICFYCGTFPIGNVSEIVGALVFHKFDIDPLNFYKE